MQKMCERSKVVIPFVLRYLTNELAAMNIKLAFKLEWKKKNKNLISNSSFVVYISIVFISVKEEKC